MAHLLDNDASGIVGAGRTFLVEESADPTQAVAAGERKIFGRRHPMRADHGAATRVYVHNLYLVDTDTASASAPTVRVFSRQSAAPSTRSARRCIWSTRSRAAGCRATCYASRAAWWAANMFVP